MYSFGPIPRQKRSGRVIGTHQKIDRVARRQLSDHLDPKLPFPAIRTILHFEGSRGPDGIKMKSPGKDEPRHFIDPDAITPDDELLVAIRNHMANLTTALAKKDDERAGFEAAWLAHAVTDGLTPAHHEPFDEQTKELRPDGHETTKVAHKFIMGSHGTRRSFVRNNWNYWGAKGIMTTHTLFEGGVAAAVKPLTFADAGPSAADFARLADDGFEAIYIDMIHQVAALDMYERFKQTGWTRSLALETTRTLMPIIIRAVTLGWYAAYHEALESA